MTVGSPPGRSLLPLGLSGSSRSRVFLHRQKGRNLLAGHQVDEHGMVQGRPCVQWEPVVPRFFFNLRDGQAHGDETGTQLADLKSARQEAMRKLGNLLASSPDRFCNGHDWRMEVTDGSGLLMFRIDLMTTDSPSVSDL